MFDFELMTFGRFIILEYLLILKKHCNIVSSSIKSFSEAALCGCFVVVVNPNESFSCIKVKGVLECASTLSQTCLGEVLAKRAFPGVKSRTN